MATGKSLVASGGKKMSVAFLLNVGLPAVGSISTTCNYNDASEGVCSVLAMYSVN